MKTFVIIPTYNEAENIGGLITKILELNIEDLHVLVVDDNSPDGTGDMVENLAKKDKRVILLRRYKRKGRGSAGIDGFKYALGKGADYIIEMDGDFSHDPRYIPEFIGAIKDCDVVLGSRFVRGGRDVGRGLKRKIITKLAGIYVRCLLKIDIKEVCRLQRGITNQCWMQALESVEGMSSIATILRVICDDEIRRERLAKDIVVVFSRKGLGKKQPLS